MEEENAPIAIGPVDEPGEPAAKFRWSEHRVGQFALLLTVVPVLVATVRVYVVANGEDVVLKSLAANLNIQALMLGTYLPVLPMLLVIAAIKISDLDREQLEQYFGLHWAVAIAVALFILGFLLLDLKFAAGLVVLVLFGFVVGFWRRRGANVAEANEVERERNKKWFPVFALKVVERGLLGLVALILIFGEGLWLPANAIAIKGQIPPTVAFVLNQSDGQTTLLFKEPASVRTVPTADITNRLSCVPFGTSSGWMDRPVYTYIFPLSLSPGGQRECEELISNWPGVPEKPAPHSSK